jgi:superoxide reductase
MGKIFRCNICGNVVEHLFVGGGQLVCCGQSMIEEVVKKSDEGQEKHVPVISGKKVVVGSILHPMIKEHYIEWIEATDGIRVSKVFLKAGDVPEAEFEFEVKKARIYCNLHGLWESK